MIRKNTLSLAMMLTLLLAASGSVWGTDLYWSGTGTWDDGSTTNWGVAPGGPYNVSAWVGGANAIFEGTAGTVTVSGTIASVGSITFTTDGYTLQTGTLTLTGADGNITTGAGTDTISAIIAGTVVTKLGSGTLILSGANTFSSSLTIKAGTVSGTTSAAAFGTGTIIIGDASGGSANATLSGGRNGTFTNLITVASTNSGVATITGTVATSVFSGAVTLNTHDLQVLGGSTALTLSGGITGTGNLTLNSNGTGVLTLSTASVNPTGTITNSGTSTGDNVISGGVGANVTAITQNSAGSGLTISTTALSVNTGGTTLTNTAGGSALTVSGGVTGTGNLIINNNSATAAGITLTTASVNNTGTITNSGVNAGTGTVTITGGVGANVTAITLNSTTSALTISTTALTVASGGTTLTNTAGTKALTVSGGVTGTGNLIINNNSDLAAGVTLAAVNHTGTMTNSGTNAGTGTVTITGIVGTNVTGVVQNSATSQLTLSGVNTFSTGLTIKAGTVSGTTSVAAFGAGTITIGDASGGSANATLNGGLNGTFTNPITVASTNSGVATITGTVATSVFSGGVTLNTHNLQVLGGSTALTLSGGITGTGNLTLNSNGTGVLTFSTASVNPTGTITNSGTSTGDNVISGGVGANVTAITQNSAGSALTISTTALSVNAGGTTLTNTAGGSALTVSGGVDGTGNLIINNNSALAAGVTLAAINHTGTITNSGVNAGTGTVTITGIIGTNVTGVVQNSTTSQLTLSGANTFSTGLTIKAGTVSGTTNAAAFGTGTITIGDASGGSANATLSGGLNGTFTNLITVASTNSGVATITGTVATSVFSGAVTLNTHDLQVLGGGTALTLSGGITGTGNLTINSNGSGVLTLSTASVNPTGTITNSGTSTGDNVISGGVGANVTAITQNSAGSALTISTTALSVNAGGTTLTNTAGGSALTVSGGVTGTGNLIINNNSATAAGITLTTASVNNTGTISNSGVNAGTGTVTITGGVGPNVTAVTLNSTTSALTISTTALSVASGGTTLTNTAGTKALTVSSGVDGTGNLIINNNSDLAAGVTLAAVNHTGTITNSGTNAGTGTVTITGIIGTNVTGVVQNSATSQLTLSGANTFSTGLTIKAGTVSGTTSADAFGTGTITIGDASGGSANATLSGGRNGTFTNLITVASTNSGVATITGTVATSVFSGAVTLNTHDLQVLGGSTALTLSGGITGTGHLTLNSNGTGVLTLSTASVNNTGTITNSGTSTGDNVISGGVGANVTAITQNSAGSALTISTTALSANTGGTTLTNTAGGSALTVSGGVTGTGNLIINNNSALAAGVTLTTNSINNTGTITNSGVNAGTGTVTITGGVGTNVTGITLNSTTSALTISTTAITVNSGGTTLTNSSGTQLLTVSGGVNGTGNLIINNNSSTDAGVTITTASTVSNIGAVINSGSGTGTVTITRAIDTNVTAVTQNSATSALTLSGTNTFTGVLSVLAGTLSTATVNNASASGPLGNSANAVVLGSSGGVSGTLKHTGVTASSTKTFTLAAGGTGVFQVDTGGTTLTLSSGIGGTGNLTKTGAGTLTLSGATNNCGTLTLTNGDLNAGAATTINIVGNLILTSGIFTAPATINITGDWTNNGGTFTPGTDTVNFNSTAAGQAINGTAVTQPFNHLTVAKTAQTLSVGGSTTTLTLSGNLTLTSGVFTAPAVINIAGNLTNNGGTFTPGTGTVVLNGTNQTVGGTVAMTFNHFTKDVSADAARTLTFTAGKTQTITGTLTLKGGSGKELSLRSSATGTQWNINPQGTRDLDWLIVKDSLNVNATAIDVTAFNSTDSANNTNWIFSVSPDITWLGDGNQNNWNVGTNWEGGVVPGPTNVAHFIAAYPNNCNFNVNVSVAGLDIQSGYPGTINQSGRSLTVDGNWTQAGGTFTGSSTINVIGNVVLSGGTINAATPQINSPIIFSISGNWTNNGGTFNPSTGNVNFNSTTADQVIGGTAVTQTFYNMTIDKTAQTLSVGGSTTTLTLNGSLTLSNGTFIAPTTINIAGNWAYTAGTFTAGTGTVTFNAGSGSQTLNSGGTGAGKSFYNLTHSGAGTLQLLTNNIDIDGTFTNSAGTFDTNGLDMFVAGNWTNSATFTAGTRTVTFDAGSGTQTLNSGGTGTNNLFYNLTHSGAGTLQLVTSNIDIDGVFTNSAGTFDTNGRDMSVAGNWANSATFTAGTRTVTFDAGSGTQTLNSGGTGAGKAFYNLTHSGAGTVQLITNDLDIDGAFVDAAGIFDLNSKNLDLTGGSFSNDGTLLLQGGETLTAFTNDTDSGTIDYNGTGTYASLAAGNSYKNLTFSGSGGSWTHSALLTVNGTLTLSAGTLNSGTQAINLAGNWTKTSGIFNSGTGTVTLNGTNQTITGENSFCNLTKIVANAAILTFGAGATQTVTGTLILQGASGQLLSLRSLAAGTQWKIDPQGTRTISYLDVQDSWNTNAALINALGQNCTDSGNNTKWLFGTPSLYTWLGTGDGNWNTDANWYNSTKPPGDGTGTVYFIGTYPASCTINTTVDVAGMSIASGYQGTITQGANAITVGSSGWTHATGTFTGGTEALSVAGNLTLSSGVFTAPATVNIVGNWTNNGCTFTPGTGTVNFNSTTAAQAINGTVATQTFNHLTLAKSAQTLSVGGSTTALTLNGTLTLTSGSFTAPTTLNITGDWTNNGGTFTPGAGTVNFNSTTAGQAINGTAVTQTFNHFTVAKTAQTLSVGGSTTTLTLNGDLTLTSGGFTAPTAINIAGDWTNNGGTFTSGTGTVTLNGTSQAITGVNSFHNLNKTVAAADTLTFAVGQTQTVTGTLTLQGAVGQLLALRSSTTGTQWKIDPQGTRTVSYLDVKDSWNINATIINAVGQNCTDSSNNTQWLFGTPLLYTWLGTDDGNWNTDANWYNSTKPPGNGTGTVYFIGAYPANCTINTTVNVAGVSIAMGYQGTITQNSSSVTVGASDWVQTDGTFTGGNVGIDINGDWALSGGSFTTTSDTLAVSGAFNHSGGTFTHNGGTVTLDGAAQTLYGDTTFNHLAKIVAAADTLTFEAAKTQTIAGTLTLQGASGQLLSLRSTATGTQWRLNPQGTRTIGYLDVKDSRNTHAAVINAVGQNCSDSGNNLIWLFLTPADFTWLGTTSTSWNLGANWQGGSKPGSGNVAYFVSAYPNNCSIDATVNVAGLDIQSGYSGTITQGAFAITVGASGWTQAGGTFTGSANAITFNHNFTLSGGTFTAGAQTITSRKNWTISGGTLDAITNNSSVEFENTPPSSVSGTHVIITGSHTLNNMKMNTNEYGSASVLTVADNTTITVMGTLTLSIGFLNQVTIPAGGTINAQGSVLHTKTFNGVVGGNGRLHLTGNSTRTVTLDAGYTYLPITLDAPNTTLTTSGTGTIEFDGAVEVKSGSMQQGDGVTFKMPSLILNNPGTLQLGVNGKLILTGMGTPLTGTGIIDSTTKTPNTIEFAALRGTTNCPASAPVNAYHHLSFAADLIQKEAALFTTSAPDANHAVEYSDIYSAAIDVADGYAYFGGYTKVIQVRLSDFSYTTISTLDDTEKGLGTAVIDTATATHNVFFSASSSTAGEEHVLRVSTNPFARTDRITLASNTGLTNAEIDPANHRAYFANGDTPCRIFKINTETFGLDGAPLDLAADEGGINSSCIDLAAGFVYFGCSTGKIVKIRLSDFTRVGFIQPTITGYGAATIDPITGYAYFGTQASPSNVVRIRLSDFSEAGQITLNAGEIVSSAVIIPGGQHVYFGTNSTLVTDGVVVVRQSDFTRLDSLQRGTYRDYKSGVVDTVNGFAYFSSSDGSVVKMRLGEKEGPHSFRLGTANGQTLTLNGDLSIGRSDGLVTATVDGNVYNPTVNVAGGVALNASSTLTAASGNLSVGANWSNSGGTFTAGTGTVTLSGTNDQTIYGATTFYNLTKDVSADAARNLYFEFGKTQTIANTLTLKGGAGKVLSLRSTSSGSVWQINPQGTRTIDYLDVQDSNNINATAMNATGANFTNLGNNTNWTFDSPVANYTWLGTTSTSWKLSANWQGGNVPGSGNTAYFVSAYSNNCDIDDPVNVAALVIASGYTGTIAQGAYSVTIGASGWAQAGGVFAGYTTDGTKNITISGPVTISGGTFTSTAGTLAVSGNWTNSATFTAGTGTVTFNAGSGTQTLNSGGTGAGKLFYNLTHSGAGTLQLLTNNIDIDGAFINSAGTFDVNGRAMTVAGNWTNSATFTAGTGIVTFDAGSGTQTLNSGGTGAGKLFYNLTHSGAGTLQLLTSDIDIDGAFTNSAGTFDTNSRDMNVAGNWTNAATFTAGTRTVTFDASSGTQSLNSGGTGAGKAFYNLTHSRAGILYLITNDLDIDGTFNNTSGTFNANDRDMTVAGNWANYALINAGIRTVTFDAGSGTQTLNSGGTGTNKLFYNLTHSGAGTLQLLTSNIDINGVFTNSAGTFDTNLRDMNVAGNWANSATFTAGTRTVTFDASSGTQSLNSGGTGAGKAFYNITHSGAGTVQLITNDLDIDGAFVDAAGIFDLNSRNLDLTGGSFSNDGTLLLQGGETLTAFTNDTDSGTIDYNGTGTYAALVAGNSYKNLTFSGSGGSWTHSALLTVNGALTLSAGTLNSGTQAINLAGNWTKTSGTFNSGTGTVTLNGTNQTITGENSFCNLTKTVANAAILTFGAGATQTVTGTLILQGASGQLLSLRSLTTGTQWKIDPQGTRTVSYLDVQDSWNTNAALINALGQNCTDSGNNTKWLFGTPSLYTWLGTGDGNWNTDANWYNSTKPPGDGTGTVYFIGTYPTNCTINTTVDVAGMSIASGYQGTITQGANAITVGSSGWTHATGTFTGGTEAMSVTGNLTLSSGVFTAPATLNITGNWTNNGGTFTPGTGTVNFNSTTAAQAINGTAATQTFNHLTMAKSAQTLSVGGSTTALTLNGALTLTSGSFTAPTTLNIAGDWTNNGGTFTPGMGTVNFNNTTAVQAINGTAVTQSFNHLTVAKTAQTLNVGGATTTLTLSGDLTLTNGVFNSPATVNIAGNWTNNGGTFTPGTGTVVLNGTNQTVGGTGATTFYHLIKDVSADAARTLTFTAGKTQTITGTLTLKGGSGKVLSLRSSVTGTQWKIDPQGTRDLDYLNVKDSWNINAVVINAMGPNYTDSLNNTGWLFAAPVDYTWIATSASIWNNTANWQGGVVPGPGNVAHFSSAYPSNCSINVDVSVAGMDIQSGYSGTISQNGQAVTVNGNWTQAGGTFTGGTAAISVTGNMDFSGGTFSAPSAAFTVSGNWTNTASTFTAGTGTVTFNAGSGTQTLNSGGTGVGRLFYNLTHSGAGTLQLLTSNIDIDGAFTNSAGTFDTNGRDMSVAGNWANSATFMAGTRTVTFDAGSGTQTLNSGGTGAGKLFYNLTHSGAGTLQLLTNHIDIDGVFTNVAGIFDLNGKNLDLTGGSFSNDGTLLLQGGETLTAFTNDTDSGTIDYNGTGTYASLAAGNSYKNLTFSGSGGSWTHTALLTVNGALTLSSGTLNSGTQAINLAGNWTKTSGTFNSGTGTVTLNGTNQTITGENSFCNLTKTVANADIMTFAAGATQTVTGTLILQGASGQLLSLRSTAAGTQWRLDLLGTWTVGYVDVQDGYKLTTPAVSPSNSMDSGNNTNWFESDKLNPVLTWANPTDITFGTALGGTQLNATASVAGTFAYTPAAGTVLNAGNGQTLAVDFTPTDTVNYNSATASVVINVNAVNGVPSFTEGADQTVLEDAGAQTVAGWATAISAGPANESGQALDFIVSNDNNALFSLQPAIAVNGTLTYTTAANANGLATVSVQIHDNGGTALGGVDTSAAQTFTITATPVNDVPSFTEGADQTVLEDAGAQTVADWATAISAGPANESGQALDFIVSNDNNALFSLQPAIAVNGTLTYTTAANANGLATVSVQIHDNGGTALGGVDTSAAQTFTITVTPVNVAPVALDDAYALTGGTTLTTSALTGVLANDTDADGDALTVTLVSGASNGIVVLNADGSFTYTPNAGFSGTDRFYYQAGDGALLSNIATVTLTVSVGGVPGGPTGDPDGDGFTNDEEDASGTDPQNSTSRPIRMGISMLKGIVRFGTVGRDSWLIQAWLPDLPEDFDPTGVSVSIDCGGAQVSLTLDKKGRGKAGGAWASLNTNRQSVDGTSLQIRVTAGTWIDEWADEGVDSEVSTKNMPMRFVSNIRFQDWSFVTSTTTTYSSGARRYGRFNLRRPILAR